MINAKDTMNMKLERELIEQVRTIAQKKFPLRNLSTYSKATREVLIEFIKKNQKYSKVSE